MDSLAGLTDSELGYAVVLSPTMGRDDRHRCLGGTLQEAFDDSLIETANNLGMVGSGLSERAVRSDQHSVVDVGCSVEPDTHHCPGHCLSGRVETGVLGQTDLGGQFAAVFPTYFLRHACGVFRSYALDDPDQKLREQVVPPRRELERDLFGGRFVVLGRSARPGPATPPAATVGHLEVVIGDEPIEMVPRNVGMNPEEWCDLSSSHRFRSLTDREVDATPGGVSQ